MNFIQTQDEATAKKLESLGFRLYNHQGNIWTFVNDKKLMFDSEARSNVVYTDKICI